MQDATQLAGLLGMNEEELAAAFQAGIAPEQLELLNRQLKYAEGLRGAPSPEMRQAGNVAVAASPFEFASQMYSAHKGNQMAKQNTAEMQARIEALAQQRQKAAIGALRGMNPMGAGPQGMGTGEDFSRMYGPPGVNGA